MSADGEYVDKAEAVSRAEARRPASAGDPNGAWYSSGIRLGPPALTRAGRDG